MDRLFFIVAGEASGDILGARLIKALKSIYPDASFRGIGGEQMIAEGLESLYPMERLSVMGIIPILKRFPELYKMREKLARQIVDAKPACFIGIDAPVFNTGLEYRLRKRGVTTVHYVSPSVWAWRENRIYKIAKSVSLMLCLFPFELDIYKRHRVPAVCIGHPLANEIALEPDVIQARTDLSLDKKALLVALLPGSRGSEVKFLIEPFIQTAKRLFERYPDCQFVVPCANPRRREQIETYLASSNDAPPIILVDGHSRQVMLAADVVLLASGTATLEAMLLKKPMLVAYKMSAFSFWIFKKLLKINQYSLPNLLAGEKIVDELIQEDCEPDQLFQAMCALIENRTQSPAVKRFYQLHRDLMLGGSEKAAEAISSLLEEESL